MGTFVHVIYVSQKPNYYKAGNPSWKSRFKIFYRTVVVNNIKKFETDELKKSDLSYPLEDKKFDFTEYDSLVNLLVEKVIYSTNNYNFFKKWLNYLRRFGHYDRAFDFSKKCENILLQKLFEFDTSIEHLDLVKSGLVPMEKLIKKNRKESTKWVNAYKELKEFQYYYHKFKNEEDLMIQSLNDYDKIYSLEKED